MSIEFNIIKNASMLPADWDEAATDYFQTRQFLDHTEKYNPCSQRYITVTENGSFRAGAVMYTLQLDLLTFIRIKSPVKMHIAGIPCSVSCPGILGEEEYLPKLKEYIFKIQKGFVLLLNLPHVPVACNHAFGKTLPTVVFENRFSSWSDYVSALRSDYRRRLSMILKNKDGMTIVTTGCSEFTPEMHEQYLAVYKKSKDKLEKLDHSFFRNLPDPFRLTVCRNNDAVIGWNITLMWKQKQYFFLGGIDYRYNMDNNTYLRLMANIIKDGIESGAKQTDLGQTAEIPKMRMGGVSEKRYMEAKHSNSFFNMILKSAKGMLSYKRDVPPVSVFKGGTK